MANYTVRVELIGVDRDADKYEKLHDEMKNEGFWRTISLDATGFKLPPAEYSKITDDTKASVLDAAKNAATSVMGSDKKHRILVTRSEEPRAQWNLEPK
ncbi:hypothetical protein [Paraburkholderia aspalathi]|uniref:DUF2622 domain-containing protein n=1 Tax=Paraburkholderia aspalathi TaxID=1324617 RepID=A0A1I7ERF5_9BURK|nr:hypothetical protein [Paraburkholderia aspalathi]SFU26490.1 hypothetical protein SAMN05192563_10571 [Paraburkholderia aspalathi]